jgi:hypothetical protein
MAGKCALARREVSLVDVEFAATGPVKIDLNEILKFAFAASRQRGLHSRSVHGGRLAQDTATRIARLLLAVLVGSTCFSVTR